MIVLLLLAAPLPLGEREAGPMRVRLSVVVPEQGAGPALAAARLELEADGPATMRLAEPRLEDPLAAWRLALSSASCDGGRRAWSAQIVQTKSGPAGLPGVSVRVQAAPGEPWHELSWHDPLGETRAVAPPEPLPPLPPRLLWPWVAGGAGLLLAGAGVLFLQRRTQPPPSLSPRERALSALEAVASFDALEAAVRLWLSEERGAAARTSTSAEVGGPLGEVLAVCEQARFAPLPPGEEPLRQATAQARQSMTATESAGPGKNAEDGKSG